MAAQTTAPIGWYDMGDGSMRYWDGTQWVGSTPSVFEFDDAAPPTTQQTSPVASAPTRRWRQWSPWMQFWVVILTVLTVPLLVLGGQMMFGGFFAQPITAVSSETAELRDDVRLNRPIDLGHGNITVLVSVTNTGETTADYKVLIYALVSDDNVDFENWITFENVAPGQTADANLLFHTSKEAYMLVKDISRLESSGSGT